MTVSSFSLPAVPHAAIPQQMAAPQPPVWLLVVAYLIPANLLSALTGWLMHWPAYAEATRSHHTLYFGIFAGVQIACVTGAAILVGWRYRSALWQPRPRWRSAMIIAWLMLLPLAVYQTRNLEAFSKLLEIATGAGREGSYILHRVFFDVWNKMPYGSTLEGVWCWSILSFTAPVWEEILFSGCVLNRINRRWGIWIGVLGSATLFTLSHIGPYGFGTHLWALLFAGVTYAGIRVVSGSLWMSIAAHLLINTIIFLPKWGLALLHFRYT